MTARGKEILAETEEMTEQELDQYQAYNEEQDRLEKLYNKQEKKAEIEKAIALLESYGYQVI